MKVLGVDLGTKRIGLALGDTQGKIAVGLPTIKQDKKTFEEIKTLIDTHKIEKIIVGLPKTLNGRTGEQAGYTQKWANELSEQLGIDIVFEDERLSSKMARDGLISIGRELSKENIDQAAAVLILQGYLDKLAS